MIYNPAVLMSPWFSCPKYMILTFLHFFALVCGCYVPIISLKSNVSLRYSHSVFELLAFVFVVLSNHLSYDLRMNCALFTLCVWIACICFCCIAQSSLLWFTYELCVIDNQCFNCLHLLVCYKEGICWFRWKIEF